LFELQVILENVVPETLLVSEQLLILLVGFDLLPRQVAHHEAHLHQPEDALVDEEHHLCLLVVDRSVFPEFLLLLFEQRVDLLIVFHQQNGELLFVFEGLQADVGRIRVVFVEFDEKVVEVLDEVVKLNVAFFHISKDTDHLTSFQILFQQVVFNYVVQKGEAVFAASKGSHNPVPLENVLFECEKNLIKNPFLLLIVDGFEIVDVRNKQYNFSDAVDDVEMIFNTFEQVVKLL
jgi:hypothetical protein